MRKWFAVAVCGGLVWARFTFAAEERLQAGVAQLEAGDSAAATATFQSVAAEAFLHLAWTQRGEERQATLARAAELTPANATALRAWIAAYQQLDAGKNAEAAENLRLVVVERPRDARLRKTLGDALARADDRAGALAAYQAAVGIDSAYAPALIALGDAQRESGDFGAAYNSYNHAVGPDGKPVGALLGRAAARHLLGDRQGSLADLELAAGLAEPGSERSRALMGWFYVQTAARALPSGADRAEQAVAMWQEQGRADMAAATANAAARAFLETGLTDAAETWYERGWQIIEASSMKPEERTIWQVRHLHARSRIAARRRDFTLALDLAGQAKQLMDADSANAEHYAWIYPYLLGYIHLERRAYEEALAELTRSEVERPYIQYLIAEAYARQRDRDNARNWYQRALANSNGLDVESVVVRPLAERWLQRNPPRP